MDDTDHGSSDPVIATPGDSRPSAPPAPTGDSFLASDTARRSLLYAIFLDSYEDRRLLSLLLLKG
jgi:hypothetical protein